MKDTGIILWATPNQLANNSSGFTGLPGGYRNASGEFGSVGKNGKWWSSTDYNTEGGISRQLNYYNGEFSREDDYKRSGFSIRCLKD